MAGAGTTTQVGGLDSGGGVGTVTQVSVVTANGFSGTVATDTTTPAITLVAGAITPTTVNGLTISTTTGTLTLANGSTLVTSGANSITLTSTGATNVTLPTTGTLATLAGTETLTNKTLTTPKIGAIYGSNSHNVINTNDAGSAVNYWDVFNSNAAGAMTIRAGGSDTNIGVNFYGKGTGAVVVGVSTSTNTDLYGVQIGQYTASGTKLLTAAGVDSLATVTANTNAVTNIKQTTLNTSGTAATGLGVSDITTIEIAAGTTVSSMTQSVYLTNGTNGASNVIWNLYTGSGSLNVLELLSTSGIKMGGSTSGYVTVKPSAVAGDYTLTLPVDDGTSGYVLQTDGSGVTSWVAQSGGSGGVGSSIVIYKSADEIVASSTTVQDDDEFSFAIAANETWKGVWFPAVISGTTEGWKIAVTIPSGATGRKRITWGTTGSIDADITTAVGGTFQWLIQTYGRITFTVVNGSTAGTVQFQWAQNVSGGANTTLRAGSYLTATRTA